MLGVSTGAEARQLSGPCGAGALQGALGRGGARGPLRKV